MEMDFKLNNLMLVGMGASAGGLLAIQSYFERITYQENVSFVVVMHLSPNFDNVLVRFIAKYTQLNVVEITHESLIQAGMIYVSPPDKFVLVKKERFILVEKKNEHFLKFPIDIFLESLAQEFGKNAMAIILSGAGSDGARGIQRIKEEGGVVFVQSPLSAKFTSMPNASIQTDLVDGVYTEDVLAENTMAIAGFSRKQVSIGSDYSLPKQDVDSILSLLHKEYGYDFSNYNNVTIKSCIRRRMILQNFESVHDYFDYLTTDKNELKNLQKHIIFTK